MVELSIIRDFVAIFGVIAGFSYYVLTVRNQQKTQRTAEQNRQIQLLMEFTATEEGSKRIVELLKMEWTDYDDFERKYGSDNNPDNYAKRTQMWSQADTLGYMLKKGLIDRELLFDRMGTGVHFIWVKFEKVIKEIRSRYNQPLAWIHYDYLIEEYLKYMQEKGIDTTVPNAFFSYVPDQ